MITSMYVINTSTGRRMDIALSNPEPTGLYVIETSGLGSPDVSVSTGSVPEVPGEYISNVAIGARHIELTIGIGMSHLDEEVVRQDSVYDLFSAGSPIRIGFITTIRDSYIDGVVEENDTHIFTKVEHTTISITCPSPYFIERGSKIVTISGVSGGFTFPFHSPPLLYFGDIVETYSRDIVYAGAHRMPAGVLITMTFSGLVQHVRLRNVTHDEHIYINTDLMMSVIGENSLSNGDSIIIDTRTRTPSVILVRYGVEYDLINTTELFTKWIYIHHGTNTIAVSSDIGNRYVEARVEYNILREGV